MAVYASFAGVDVRKRPTPAGVQTVVIAVAGPGMDAAMAKGRRMPACTTIVGYRDPIRGRRLTRHDGAAQDKAPSGLRFNDGALSAADARHSIGHIDPFNVLLYFCQTNFTYFYI